MKTVTLLLVFFLPSMLYAQHKHKKHKEECTAPPPPRVWVSNIFTYNTVKDSILAHPQLNTDSAGCRVSGFTISLQAPGQPFFGPLYSNTWEMTETQKDIIKKWDHPNTTLYVQDIHLNCHEKDATSPPFSLHFDH